MTDGQGKVGVYDGGSAVAELTPRCTRALGPMGSRSIGPLRRLFALSTRCSWALLDASVRMPMNKPIGTPVDLTRYVLEILFAGTLAAAFVTKLINSNEIYWNSQFFGWEAGLNHSFHRSYNDHLGQNLAFGIISTALAAVGFLLLRIIPIRPDDGVTSNSRWSIDGCCGADLPLVRRMVSAGRASLGRGLAPLRGMRRGGTSPAMCEQSMGTFRPEHGDASDTS